MMSVTRQVQYSILGLIAGIVLLSFLKSSLHGDVTPVVLAGQPAPGTANGRFTGMNGASVNASGDMAFAASLDVGGVASAGIYANVGGILSPIALEGQAVPDSSGLFFGGGLLDPQINNNGDIVFVSNFASNAAGGNFGWGVYLYSGGKLGKVVDTSTIAPGTPGQMFTNFAPARINDLGDIAFIAGLRAAGNTSSGLFLVTKGSVLPIVFQSTFFSNAMAINNHDDIVFRSSDGISEYSGGAIKPVAGPGNGVPSQDQVDEPWINDDGDVVFVDYVLQLGGRGGALLPVANAVFRSRQGVVAKIAAAGDPIPGIAGAKFWTEFEDPRINESGIVFTGATAPASGVGPIGLICRFQNGQLNVVAREDQPVSGIGTLNFFGLANFDNRQGALMTFWANPGVLGTTTGPMGIFSTTVGQFPMLLPHIADGTATSGGWRTTFILANQSTATSPAPASATISFYDDSGAPLTISIGGQPQNQVTVTVPALGVAQFQTDGVGALKTGWAKVQSDQSLSGIAVFGFSDSSGNFAGEVGVPAAVPLRSMSLFVQADSNTATGIALANPNTSTATVTLILKDSNANEIVRSSISVPALGHLAKYAGEIFPGAVPSGNFAGKMDVVSTLPLVAVTLRQRGPVFTSFPIIP